MNLVAEHVDVEPDARQRVANFVGHVGGHASDSRQSLRLDEARFRRDGIRHVIGDDQNPTSSAVAGFVAKRSHEHIDQSLREARNSLALEGSRSSSLGNVRNRASEGRKASKKRGVVDRRAYVACAGSENFIRSWIGRLDHAVAVNDHDRRPQRLDDLNLHSLKPLLGKRRLAQALVACGEGQNHPLELRNELAELVVSLDVDGTRQVTAGHRRHAPSSPKRKVARSDCAAASVLVREIRCWTLCAARS
jgi:hypothetical protein